MHQPVGYVLHAVLLARGSQIAVLIPVGLQVIIDGGGHDEAPDIELPILVQQRSFNILLDDVGSLLASVLVVGADALDMGQVSAYVDTTASVGILARLYNPHFLAHLGVPYDVRAAIRIVINGSEAFEFLTVDSLSYVES